MEISADNSVVWRTLFRAAYRRVPAKRVGTALVLAIFLHILFFATAPKTLVWLAEISPQAQSVTLAEPEKVVVPEALLPEEFRKKKEPVFVPVNPNAPEEKPPETQNQSAADQRAAQENPDPTSRSRKPTNDGEDGDSRAIAEQVVPRELLPESMRMTRVAPATQKQQEQANKADALKEEAPKKDVGIDVPESESGTVSVGKEAGDQEQESSADAIPDPQERPQIAPPPGLKLLTMKSNTATNEIGAVSLDAEFSEFGDYTQRMLEAIQAAWYVTCERSAVQSRGSVVVRFTLCSDGTIKRSAVLHSSASELATYACRDAIESRAPYEKWGEEMVALFGEEQSTTITFIYR